MSRAVIYARVSTEEQVSNLSLDVQVRVCEEYCARQGWAVNRVYREEGESARTADRTELQNLLKDLRQRPGLVEFVVVYDTSRFARDVYVHASLKQLLMKSGTRLRAATQPLEDSAAGRAIEGVFAVFNQLDNELRAEKVTAGMRETVARGRWPWAAPLGYTNGRESGRKVVVPNDSAPLVRQCFELVAAGTAPAEALAKVTALGLRSRKGRALRYADFIRILQNPFYAGVARSKEWGIEVEGDHQALVDKSTWHRVQAHLSGRAKAEPSARREEHPDFPLRGSVHCSFCRRPLTASWSRGKTGAKYGYYRCWDKTCGGGVNTRAGRLEELFAELLRSVEVSPPMARLVEATLLDIWEDLRRQSREVVNTAKRRQTQLEARKKRLMEAFVYEQAIDRETYNRELGDLDEAITMVNLELHENRLDDLDLEAALGFARHVMTNTYTIWAAADPTQKRRLQRLVFPEGVSFNGEALGTPVIAMLFSMLREETVVEVKMVEQKGLEPSTPTLRTWCSPS